MDALGTFAMVGEDDDAAVGESAEQVDEGVEFVFVGGDDTHDLHAVAWGVFFAEVYNLGFARELREIVGELDEGCGGGEDDELESGEFLAYAAHFVGKSEFEGLVVFVEHEGVDTSEVDLSALDVVEQSAGGCDDDVGGDCEGVDLFLHGVATVEGYGFVAGGERADHFEDLHHEFACGSDDYGLDTSRGGSEATQKGNCECESFARAGGCEESVGAAGWNLGHAFLHGVEFGDACALGYKFVYFR